MRGHNRLFNPPGLVHQTLPGLPAVRSLKATPAPAPAILKRCGPGVRPAPWRYGHGNGHVFLF
jgi:hypothetical protein